MNRLLVLILGTALCCSCDSSTPAPTSQPANPQPLSPASGPSLQSAIATTQSALPPRSEAAFYQEDFQKTDVGEVPTEFLVLDGAFAVRELDGNRVLELPGEPLSMFGLLFGPSETDNVAVHARFNGTRKGRKYPSFGVGLGGASGYHLIVAAAKDAVELHKDEEVVASTEYRWTAQTWTQVLLRVRKAAEGEWHIEGKVWPQTSPEPIAWMISLSTGDKAPTGRASLWGSPYAGTPIQFDDLALTRVGDESR